MRGGKGMGLWNQGFRNVKRWGRWSYGGEYEFPGYGPAMWWDIQGVRTYATVEEELIDLHCRAQMLTQELETIRQRIAHLEAELVHSLDG